MKKLLCLLLALSMLIAPCAFAEGIPFNFDAMQPVLDSVMRALGDESYTYDPENDEFVIATLYLAGVNFGYQDPFTYSNDDGYVAITRDLMAAYTASAFPTLAAIPAFNTPDTAPEYTSYYDAQAEYYFLPGSDMGDTMTALGECIPLDNGTLRITLLMLNYEDTLIDEMAFTLAPAPDGATFPYVITAIG